MRKLTSESNFETPSENEVLAFSNSTGIPLPSSLRKFYSLQNPSRTKECVTVIGEREYHISTFFPLTPDYSISLARMYALSQEFLENSFIPFGCDPGGWLFLFSLRQLDFGKIYFFRTDHSIYDGLTLLADSFEEFIENLRVDG
jgi:hypothetical protein